MLTYTNSDQLHAKLDAFRKEHPDKIIGFVPTMGALHEGHISLIKKAKSDSDLVVCSIFINPTQFNNPADLDKYPRTPEKDQKLLSEAGCDILYMPSYIDVYPEGTANYAIELGHLDKVMEGSFRPGHFKGVAMVVERFFRLIQPNKAFFGIKDFQQVAVIRYMVALRQLKTEIIECPTRRAANGLALSSRNERLSDQQLSEATIIYKTLVFGKERAKHLDRIEQLQEEMIAFFNEGSLELEYLEIVRNLDLSTPEKIEKDLTCCIAAYCGEVRLIDNMKIL